MAKKFHFRLEAVQAMRARERDERRRAVADAVRAVTAEERRIDLLSEQLRDNVKQTRDERSGNRLDLVALRGQQFHQSWLHGRLFESFKALSESEKTLEVERAKLGLASSRLKAIEKLREKRWIQHVKQLDREEQAINDESAGRTALCIVGGTWIDGET